MNVSFSFSSYFYQQHIFHSNCLIIVMIDTFPSLLNSNELKNLSCWFALTCALACCEKLEGNGRKNERGIEREEYKGLRGEESIPRKTDIKAALFGTTFLCMCVYEKNSHSFSVLRSVSFVFRFSSWCYFDEQLST